MIESILRAYMVNKLNIDTFLDAPSEKPDKYFLIRKSSSSGDRFIEDAIFIILCVSKKSLAEAAEMNEDLKNAMYDMAYQIPSISRVELNSDGNWTDTTSKFYRYQAIYNITYHREVN